MNTIKGHLTEEQKEALRSAYDATIQQINESMNNSGILEYTKWSCIAEGMLRAGRALDFDLYQDWCQRHP